jgi:hypothetical protein
LVSLIMSHALMLINKMALLTPSHCRGRPWSTC